MQRILLRLTIAALTIVVFGCSQQTSTPPSQASPPAVASIDASVPENFRSAYDRWNYYRQAAGLPPINVDPNLNLAAEHHAKYLVKNHIPGGDAIVEGGRLRQVTAAQTIHEETRGNSWYTEDGAKVGAIASVLRAKTIPPDGAAIIDDRMRTGLNAMTWLDPQIGAVGFGAYCESGDCVISTAVQVGLNKEQYLAIYQGNAMDWNPQLGRMPLERARLRKPLEFPADGMQIDIASFNSIESPNPLSSCGYAAPSGLPIFLEMGQSAREGEKGDTTVKLSQSSITQDGNELESCGFDATTYRNPDKHQENTGRNFLNAYGAVMIIPQIPLQPGHKYTVSVIADAEPYSWSFTVAPDAK